MSDTAVDESHPNADPHRMNSAVVDAIVAALAANDLTTLQARVTQLHTADIADLIEQITPEERQRLVVGLGAELDPAVLTELEEGVRDEVLEHLDPAVLVRAVTQLETDDAVYLLEDLDVKQRGQVLSALDVSSRRAVETSLHFPEDTAGRMMQPELVSAPPFWTVGQIIDFMRMETTLPEQFYEIFIVDVKGHPIGIVPLGKLMASRRQVVLETIMQSDVHLIPCDMAERDVAYVFAQYHLISAPVVDADGRLIGAITIDDAVTALDDQAELDLHHLGGVGDEDLADSVAEVAVRRSPWLLANLITAVLASLVISFFDDTIDRLVALAVLMPIVASMGGNAGTQSLTVAVRALATRDLTDTNAQRIVLRELLVGLVNGAGFAIIGFVVAYVWYGNLMLGAVLGLAMIVNLLVAALAGILVPLACDRAGADPALASSTFVTTVTDVVGFFTFLGLAAWLLL